MVRSDRLRLRARFAALRVVDRRAEPGEELVHRGGRHHPGQGSRQASDERDRADEIHATHDAGRTSFGVEDLRRDAATDAGRDTTETMTCTVVRMTRWFGNQIDSTTVAGEGDVVAPLSAVGWPRSVNGDLDRACSGGVVVGHGQPSSA